MLPTEETGLMHIHCRVGFMAETGYGISSGKLPMTPASPRRNLLMHPSDKGQKAKSEVYEADKRMKKQHVNHVLWL